jgi:hypothetical protein
VLSSTNMTISAEQVKSNQIDNCPVVQNGLKLTLHTTAITQSNTKSIRRSMLSKIGYIRASNYKPIKAIRCLWVVLFTSTISNMPSPIKGWPL